MRRAGLCQSGASRVWFPLRGMLGIWLGGGTLGQSQLGRRGWIASEFESRRDEGERLNPSSEPAG